MFAEELSGNANRRRQDANRERRRKLKQEQQKKALQKKKLEAKKEEGSPSQAKPLSNESSSESNATGNIHLISSEKKQLSAVEIANEQRQQRQQAYAQKVACTKIQSFFRAHRSNCRLLADQTVLLSNRLKDLSTLRGILKEQANTDYIPPPATCTTLCQQMLFISRSIPYKSKKKEHREIETRFRNAERDFKLIQQVLDLVLNPGLISRDENINPFAVWLQSTHGKKRIEAMMRLALFTATVSIVNFSTRKSCLDFVDIITGSVAADHSNTEISKIDIRTSIADFCNPILFMRECTKDSRCYPVLSSERYIRLQSTPMDLISLLRHHLVYTTGGAPIPNGSSNFRDSCIPPKQREQADALFKTVLVAIQSIALHERENSNKHSGLSRNLMQRFVSEILTVPLLTWKLSDEALQLLLSGDTCLKGMKKIYLMSLIENFIDIHKRVLSQGCIESVLCKNIPLKKANATPTQCLLANLAQLGTSCVALNGSQRNRQDFEASAVYYRFLTTLVDAIPLSTFSYRDSVVEWVSEGGHHSPVVISPLILEQCRVLVADSWVRKLFRCAMDSQILRTNEVLQKKTNTDLKMEKDLAEVEGSSVASLAAKEARVDRNRSFWKTSGWAKNLSKGVAKMLKSDRNTEQTKTHSTSGKLINTSSVSLKLARGEKKKNTVSIPVPELSKKPNPETLNESSYTSELFQALCCLYAIILSRWGGNGGKDIVRQKRIKKNDLKNEVATTSQEACAQNILSVLCFSTDFLRFSWGMVQSEQISPTIASVPVKSISVRPTYNQDDAGPAIFYVFVESLAYQLILTDDTEIHDLERPIPLHQLRRCILTLKSLLYKASCLDEVMLLDSDSKEVGHDTSYFGLAMIKASCNAMWDLYDRSSRRLLCVPKLWIIEDLMEKELRGCKTENDYVSLLSAPVLRVCPFLVSFKRRLRLFERIVYTNRVEVQGENSTNIFHTNPLKPGIPVRITRGRILEDGLATMNNLGTDMRKRISIQYYNEAGAKESGIDAGGLFKEFWTDLCAIAFDPNYALFRVTEDNCMYPNPSSGAAHGVDHIELFKFLGRILGKSLYESITVHPQFAHFFLSFLRGDYNYLHMFSDLSTIDSQLYSNLMFLKTYDGDAEDLCLTFTVSVDDFGGTREVPLVRNGANIDVTNANKHRYIGLVTKHYVVDRVKEQSEAFTQGLWEVIDKSWLRIFNEPELQVLISGASDGKIDVNDMRAHTQYAGGFTGIDRNVTRFWNVFSSMTSKQQAELLRFVTSCERPPPLGFATLTPPFTIQRVRIMRDGDKLPSASTCFNVLKLPTYSSEKVMRQRLIYAIESGAGFELS